MTPFLQKLVRAGLSLEALIRRAWERLGRVCLSQAELTRRASVKVEALQRRQLEAERLDRLRNPGNYQGR